MPRVFTIDGVPGQAWAGYQAAPVMGQALGLVRWAAWQGLKDAATEVEERVGQELFWLKVGVGVTATASLLTLLVALAQVRDRKDRRP